MKSESDSKICPPELAVFIRDYHGVPSAARVLERNEYLLKETPPEKLREALERFYKEEVEPIRLKAYIEKVLFEREIPKLARGEYFPIFIRICQVLDLKFVEYPFAEGGGVTEAILKRAELGFCRLFRRLHHNGEGFGDLFALIEGASEFLRKARIESSDCAVGEGRAFRTLFIAHQWDEDRDGPLDKRSLRKKLSKAAGGNEIRANQFTRVLNATGLGDWIPDAPSSRTGYSV